VVVIVIDFRAIAHSIRRWWWRLIGGRASETQCVACGSEMTIDEEFHYIYHCKRYEGISMAEMERHL
jgi:hypothetical protein